MDCKFFHVLDKAYVLVCVPCLSLSDSDDHDHTLSNADGRTDCIILNCSKVLLHFRSRVLFVGVPITATSQINARKMCQSLPLCWESACPTSLSWISLWSSPAHHPTTQRTTPRETQMVTHLTMTTQLVCIWPGTCRGLR